MRVHARACRPGTLLPLPVAHGEGRFTSREPGRDGARWRARARCRCATRTPTARWRRRFPDNPNGAEAAAAAVCNARGNVLAMMPHPERAQDLGALSRATGRRVGASAATAALDGAARSRARRGPGLALFEGLRRHLEEA